MYLNIDSSRLIRFEEIFKPLRLRSFLAGFKIYLNVRYLGLVILCFLGKLKTEIRYLVTVKGSLGSVENELKICGLINLIKIYM